jgi:hypothetical protein
MIDILCNQLKQRLISSNQVADFVSVIAGLAKPVSYNEEVPNGIEGERDSVLRFTIPVSTDTNIAPCGPYDLPDQALVPDSSQKGILYFEDNGGQITGSRGSYGNSYVWNVRLVMWLNKNLITGNAYSMISANVVTAIMSGIGAYDVNPKNNYPFTGLLVRGTNQVQGAQVFSRYTYKEEVRQYLMAPFEAYGLDLRLSFTLNPACVFPMPTGENLC